MLAIGIRYLCGRAVAKHPADSTRPEWPPHPDRVYMALVAAHYETEPTAEQIAALEWLEALPAPSLHVSPANERTTVTAFVPVNDKLVPRPASGDLPIDREHKPRSFPTAIPERDTVYLIWQDADSPDHITALNDLCGKVTYIGHSSSLTQMWVEQQPPQANLVPTRGAALYRMRVPSRGRMAVLHSAYQAGQRPPLSIWCGYAPAENQILERNVIGSVFSNNLVVFRRIDGAVLPLQSTIAVTDAMRGTIMSACPQPPPEWISGHRADGSRSEKPHLAVIALPHVGREHADGHLLGVAVVVPRNVPANEVSRCLGTLLASDDYDEPQHTRMTMGRIGEWTIQLEDRDVPPQALQSSTWCAEAKRWATVTPIVLDRFPKSEGDAETTIAAACLHIGLPRPIDVVTMGVSLFVGSPPAQAFTPIPLHKSGASRWHTHALLTFSESVSGPVLLGAGRYRGYGLCRPYQPWRDTA